MMNHRINIDRLMGRLRKPGQIGALEGGGVCRLALSNEDKAGRDLLVSWMRDIGLEVAIDRIGNITGLRAGATDGATVMIGLHIDTVARFESVTFNEEIVAGIAVTAEALGYLIRRVPSGAGHDAQMFAANCPTGMIFVPSRDGISHNIEEYTPPDQIKAGADVLLQAILSASEARFP
ncbi:MAG: M20/M25/M40 family metallo-hydrolase [Alphaproteobacteria bacterium]